MRLILFKVLFEVYFLLIEEVGDRLLWLKYHDYSRLPLNHLVSLLLTSNSSRFIVLVVVVLVESATSKCMIVMRLILFQWVEIYLILMEEVGDEVFIIIVSLSLSSHTKPSHLVSLLLLAVWSWLPNINI